MYCGKCGSLIPDGNFCQKCGAPVSKVTPSQQVYQQPIYIQPPVNTANNSPSEDRIVAKEKEPFSILGLFLGLGSILLFFSSYGLYISIVGLVFSIIGTAKKRSDHARAIFALVLNIIGLVLGFVRLIILTK